MKKNGNKADMKWRLIVILGCVILFGALFAAVDFSPIKIGMMVILIGAFSVVNRYIEKRMYMYK